MMPATPTVPPCTPGVNLVKHLRWSYALLLLLPLFDPGCAARAELSGPAAAVVVCQSHGVSATAIATGPGWTILLSCGHGWYREGQRGQPPEDERSKPMKFIFPTPAAFASGPATSRLVPWTCRTTWRWCGSTGGRPPTSARYSTYTSTRASRST